MTVSDKKTGIFLYFYFKYIKIRQNICYFKGLYQCVGEKRFGYNCILNLMSIFEKI